jgi:hypothetical protein
MHGGFTAAIPILKGQACSLSNQLKFLNDHSGAGAANFDHSDTTLFVFGVILPEQHYNGEMLPSTFVFATTYCGSLKAHLYDLIATNRNALHKMFQFCQGYNLEPDPSNEALYDFLNDHSYRSNFNSRCNNISKQDTQNEKILRKEIEDYIDKAQTLVALENHSAIEVETLIQRHIKNLDPMYAWALKPGKTSSLQALTVWEKITILLLALFVVSPIGLKLLGIPALKWFLIQVRIYVILLLIGLLISFITLLTINRVKTPTASRPPDRRLRRLAATQLKPVLNEMTATAPLKAGIARPYFYATTLRVLSIIAPFLLQIPTVSNIRWLVIDNKKRLLFLSCFANTTDSYVRDFLNKSTANGVNFLFSHGQGFPDARFSYCKGILKDPEGYMHAVHTGQQVTDLWYAHEKNLTADIINKNRKIRNGLFKKMNEEEARNWLKLL